MNSIEAKAPAKINLFLKVLGKRDDGYHDIYSWFQAIDLFDHLVFKKTSDSRIKLELDSELELPVDENNTIIKAANLLFKSFGLSGGLKIRLRKNVPISAGLGGGSSDAATTIYAINRLYNLGLSSGRMAEIGLEIGSDVPFFFSSGQAEVTGRGEIIKDIRLPLDYSVILIKPPISISTKEAYRNLKMDLTFKFYNVNFFDVRDFEELITTIRDIENDFEGNVFESHSVMKEIQNILGWNGSALTRISGSGPTVFGLFNNMPEGGEIERLAWGKWDVFCVHPINLTTQH